MQDAGRKRTGVSQSPDEWAGTMVETVNGNVFLFVFQKEWDRSISIIKRIQDELILKGCLNLKQLERDKGFLVYLSRTYKIMCSYIKGIRQTLNS